MLACATDLVSTLPLDHLFVPGEAMVLTLRAGPQSTVDRPLEETQAGWCRVETSEPTVNTGVDDTNLFTRLMSTLAGGVQVSGAQVASGGMGAEDAARIAALARCDGAGVETATATWRYKDGALEGVTWTPATPCQVAAEGPAQQAVRDYLERVWRSSAPLAEGSARCARSRFPCGGDRARSGAAGRRAGAESAVGSQAGGVLGRARRCLAAAASGTGGQLR